MNTTTTDDFVRSRLDQMIELRHPLAVLASRMPWQEIEASIAHQCFARQVRQGKKIEDVDLFGGVSALVGSGVSNAGRPRLPLRLMKSNLIVGTRSFEGNPYDGHTLYEQIEQSSLLMQDTNVKPTSAYVDLGYRGVEQDNPELAIKHRGKRSKLPEQEIKLLARRQAIEPITGHLKEDHRMGRCHLKGEEGDRLHAVLCAAGYNIRWLLRMIAKKGLRAFLRLIGMTEIPAAGGWFNRIWSSITPADAHPIPRLGWI